MEVHAQAKRRFSVKEDEVASPADLSFEAPLKIVEYPDPILRTKNKRIDTFDDSLKKLVDEMFDVMYKDMEEMVSKKQMAKSLAKLRREMLELLSKKQNGECQAIVVSNLSATNQKLDLDTSLLVPFKSDLDSSFITLEKYKEQLMVISEYMSRIEEEIKKLKSKVEEEETKLDSSALMVVTELY
ncbi:unnamed protein product [Camellia sinensis]